MTSRLKRNVRLVVALLIGSSVVLATVIARGATRTAAQSTDPARSGAEAVGSALTIGDSSWALVRSFSADGSCLEVVAEVDGVEQGSVGGCGNWNASPLSWSIGGVGVEGQWYDVALGQGSSDVAAVRLTLAAGNTRADATVDAHGGYWFVVYPADPLAKEGDITRIEALDNTGSVIGQQEVPSLAEARGAATLATPGEPVPTATSGSNPHR